MRGNYTYAFCKKVTLIAIIAVSNITAQTMNTQDEISGTESENFQLSISELTRTVKFLDSSDVVFAIYPNPVSDYFTITGFEGLKALEIYDKGGKKKKTYFGANLTRSIGVEDLENGVYWIKGYFFPKQSVFRRIVVRH
ncbi:T9SS type A sorting domain-containing protein [Aquimarina sp. 2201CG1-2-11]|uniref:T9SS type A sorting domain-containing protein n=1 Tax=Aquimarina discodermiae TaxID=3231043 RepID=UPI003462ABC0